MTTQFANASYQEIIDIKTEADKTSIIGIHTPNDSKPVNMLRGFWEQFRQFKYNGCSIQLVPAARLPADISQVGYGAGEAPIDMRDILNPIMFKGCHGNDMGVILNQALNQDEISDSVVRADTAFNSFDPYESLYYRALTDNSWKKADPQRGFRKSGLVPLVHTVVTNTAYGQIAPGRDVDGGTALTGYAPQTERLGTESIGEMGINSSSSISSSGNLDLGAQGIPQFNGSSSGSIVSMTPTSHNVAFFTNRLVRMSWQDTHSIHCRETVSDNADPNEDGIKGIIARNLMSDAYADDLNRVQTVPLAYMGILLLPPAYKAEQYFRMIINHSFSFRRFRGVSMAPIQNWGNYADYEFTQVVTDAGGYFDEV